MRTDEIRQLLGICDMRADEIADSFMSQVPHYEPQLQCAESPAELNAVIHVIHGASVLPGLQIFRNQGERTAQNFGLAGIEHAEIDGREKPLVRIYDQRMRALGAGENSAQLRHNSG